MLHGSQQAAGRIAHVIFWSLAASSIASGATVRSSANFTVLAPNDRLADMVVVRAETFRSRIGAAWLGEPLPAARTPAAIFIEIDPSRSFARSLLDSGGDRHLVWLVGTEEAVTKYLLAHEVAHVVLASRFGDRMPVWATEGIASRYDNVRRHARREQVLRGFVEIDSWPHLDQLFEKPIRQPWQYAAAVSVTEYLVQQGGRQKFIEFISDSQTLGCDLALDRHYGIRSTAQLQEDWQRAVSTSEPPLRPTPLVATATATASERYAR